jgi:hypothetical protein
MKEVLALVLLLLFVPADLTAQGSRTIQDAVSVGGTFGVSQSGNQWSGGGPGPQLAGNVEIPLPGGRVRLTLGHTRWTPSNDVINPRAERAGRMGLSRITATAVLPYMEPTNRYPLGIYTGVGIGVYRYHIQHGAASNRTARGLHALAGLEYLPKDRRRSLRVETELHFVGDPGHDQVWAYTMFGLSASVGVSRRF